MDIKELINKAKECANSNFCCTNSGFTVGAVLLTKDGKIFTGFNIENQGIMSICAERVAFVKALSELSKDFSCIVVVGKNMKDEKFIKTLPCGYCRQFMSEYCDANFKVYTYDELDDKIYEYTLNELLPHSFSLE